MSHTRNDSGQAVSYLDDLPVIELTAQEWIYPVTTADGRFKLYFHLKPYPAFAVKSFYDQLMPRRKSRTANEQVVMDADFTGVRRFIDDHFLALSGIALEDGSEPTLEQQQQWLAQPQNADFKVRAFREGIDKVGLREAAEVRPGKVFMVFGQADTRTPSEILLYSPERKTDELIRVTHTLARLSESDRHQYDKAIKFIENTRRQESFVEANWDVIEGLYNQKVKSLDGAVLNGDPCTEANKDGKDGWCALVPFCWKVYVMGSVYGDIELKNA